ncbi:5-guanidino-2-oxopentanoate decarboxylase [Congregibacter litoralis]|uniref:5-guanidino-2-oxopentanoate decarboxylase n=1 Tax=Congregibacter litoralis TaxID=393662 RepID=UPI00058D23AF|nr:5-guanidino-2-oxopentanoate decarboxylase [Congregibacter litoralis]
MNSAEAVSCGERLVGLLEAYGIDTVFGIPGNHTVQLYRGLDNSSIRHISPRHEQGAAFMADGYARASGRPAACFLISGPGLGNAITPMMQALADSVPMLVVTAVAARRDLGMGEGRLHDVPDQSALAAQCSRFSHTLMDPEELPKVLARAFAVFSSARPGPVHIQIPLDVITQDAGAVSTVPWPPVLPPAANSDGLKTLAERLCDAETPMLLVGGGAVGAGAEIRELAERLDLPVVTTVNAKGLLPRGHPLLVGGSASLTTVRQMIAASDVVLAVGTEFGETDYDMLFLGELANPTWLARIDIDPAQMCRNQRPHLALCGDARQSLASLLSLLSPLSPLSLGSLPEDGGRKGSGAARVAATRAAMLTEKHWNTEIQAFFDDLQESLPGLCLVGDSTLPTYYAVWQYEACAERRYFHSATGGGTLGYALPAALGARRVLPEEVPVVALIGDGAAQFTFMELASAVQEKLPIIVLLWNNNGYREIREGMLADAITPIGVDIDAPDFVAAAIALGCFARRVASPDALPEALKEAQSKGIPAVLELPESAFLSGPVDSWY